MSSSGLVAFGPHANCTLETCPLSATVYRYLPSLAANGTFMGLYFIAMCLHIVLGIRWKSWWFMCCIAVGCVSQIIGSQQTLLVGPMLIREDSPDAGRIMLHHNPFSFVGFMIQIICIAIAPVFYCAAIYVTISRTIENLNPSLSRIPPKLYYWVFLICDVASLVLQAVGGALSTASTGGDKLAVNLSLAGLGSQVGTLLIFCFLFVEYLVRYFRSTTRPHADGRLKIYIGALSIAILLILARCAYRVDELSAGYSGPLFHDEPLFIGLEGVLIVLAVFVLGFGHPAFAFKSKYGTTSSHGTSDVEEFGVVAGKERRAEP